MKEYWVNVYEDEYGKQCVGYYKEPTRKLSKCAALIKLDETKLVCRIHVKMKEPKKTTRVIKVDLENPNRFKYSWMN